MGARHRPQVWVVAEDTDEGEAYVWRVHCCPHTRAVACFARSKAERAAAEHLEQVAPPQEQRCTRPGEHHRRWWEVCLLCVGQDPLPLPGLAEGVGAGGA